ncbi:hypothetical protein G7Y89_g10148 [Cudoniella acicularis]|uniref:Amidase domain-containing protein n=1 Tax=Cudoniella acicularis TaxID=354080 RepID=A0A8H4VZH2_9HELO|nr:hypothetical protein G7Y89_g10148 [Cudoniella acicularis]
MLGTYLPIWERFPSPLISTLPSNKSRVTRALLPTEMLWQETKWLQSGITLWDLYKTDDSGSTADDFRPGDHKADRVHTEIYIVNFHDQEVGLVDFMEDDTDRANMLGCWDEPHLGYPDESGYADISDNRPSGRHTPIGVLSASPHEASPFPQFSPTLHSAKTYPPRCLNCNSRQHWHFSYPCWRLPSPAAEHYALRLIQISEGKPFSSSSSPLSVLPSSSVISLPSGTFFTDHDERYDFHLQLPPGFIPTTIISADVEISASSVEAAIAVPSRLCYPSSANKPLDGLRVAIKDDIDIARVETSESLKAYGKLYGSVPLSALAVQRLLDLGAVVVGKTGMNQFADAEDPTGDCVNFHAPWNPRGDGLRSPGGSSFGAGAATGSTTPSGLTLEEVSASPQQVSPYMASGLPEGPDLHIVGVLSRNYNVLELVSKHFFHTTASIIRDAAEDTHPTLIYPAHLFPVEDKAAQGIYDKTVSVLETLLNVTRCVINFNEEWKTSQTHTEESSENYFAPVPYDYLIWGQYHGRAAFRAEYQAKFKRQPYANILQQLRWVGRERMQPEHFRSIQAKREQFEVFIDGIFGRHFFMVTPFKSEEPEARDIFRPAPAGRVHEDFGWGMRPAFQSPMAGQPEIVFPVGQLLVFSQASQVKEKYGVITSLLGSREILETTGKLLAALDIPTTVIAGRVPF